MVTDPRKMTLLLEQVSNDFMLKTLSNLNAHKGAGLDGLAPKFLKEGAPQLAPVVTHIVNLSIVTKTVPGELKCAKIIPLYKKESRLEVGNYRPVSILSCMSKILEKYKLKNTLTKNNYYININLVSVPVSRQKPVSFT